MEKQQEQMLGKILTPMQYRVTQEGATEPAFQNQYHDHFQEGVYRCIVCHHELFTSEDKYPTQCGWPAFRNELPSSKIAHITNHAPGIAKTELRCGQCNSHLVRKMLKTAVTAQTAQVYPFRTAATKNDLGQHIYNSNLIRVLPGHGSSQFQLLLIEGVHFHQPENYFLQLIKRFCLLSWFSSNNRLNVIRRTMHLQNQNVEINLVEVKIELQQKGSQQVWFKEKRILTDNQFLYSFLQKEGDVSKQERVDVRVEIRLEVSLSTEDRDAKKLIRMKIVPSIQSAWVERMFPEWVDCKGKQVIYSRQFCHFVGRNSMILPYLRADDRLNKEEKDKENDLILLVNQKHIAQTPFFQDFISRLLLAGQKIPKIIGHPISLLLAFLINPDQSYNLKAGDIMQNYTTLVNAFQVPPVPKNSKPQQHLYHLIQQTLGEQNLLEPSFIDFFAQNMANQGFVADFVQLIRLYYQIFLGEDISEKQIQSAIAHNFYQSFEEDLCTSTTYFSTILKSIQFKHDLYYKQLASNLDKHVEIGYHKKILTLTLKEMYEYNNVEFTFVGLDVDDRIVRFFNHTTTPYMPVAAILSLSQILPTPFKALRWRQQWGYYHFYSDNQIRMIDITGHEIIDSRFLLECPLDLLQDQHIRFSYFSQNCSVSTSIEAVVSSRIKAQDLMHVNQIKTLLKSMKNNAIDCLPKLKLIWKILTTKNRVDIDINQIETLYQIPILQKILKINETFKNYLLNLNKEANSKSIININLVQYGHLKHKRQQILQKVRRVRQLIEDNFISGVTLQLVNKDQKNLDRDLKQLQIKLKLAKYLTHSQTFRLIAEVKNILKDYNLRHKYLFRKGIIDVQKQVHKMNCMIDPSQIRIMLIQLFASFRQAQFGTGSKVIDSEIRSTSNYRQVFTCQQTVEGVNFESLAIKLAFFEKQVSKAINQKRSEHTQETLNFQFRKLMYDTSLGIHRLLASKVETERIKVFYGKIYEVTPQLYNIQQILKANFLHNDIIGIFLRNIKNQKPIHLILKSKPNTVLQQAHHLLNMREILQEQKKERISTITSSGFSSILAFLFCLKITKDELLKQIVGWQQLIKTRLSGKNEANIDIKELLSRKVDTQEKLYCQGKDVKIGEIRLRLQRKYMNLVKQFNAVDKLFRGANHYKIQNIYCSINSYDSFLSDDHIYLKQTQIKKYLKTQIEGGEHQLRKKQLLQENEEMLSEKIQFNKVGLKFIIHFLYHEPMAAHNWENIHKKQYHDLQQLKLYLYYLFKKYSVPHNISLKEFNKTNYHKIKLSFNFINHEDLIYETINQNTQPSLSLVDLLLTSVSDPVYFGAYPLATQHPRKVKHYNELIRKIGQQMTASLPVTRYWSNNTLNPLPFNIVRPTAKDQNVIAIDLNPFECDAMQLMMPEMDDSLRFKAVNAEENEKKLTAIDLISFWWTKPKKLTPQLKDIMFGNIYQSPFMKFYFFLQNNSYEHLNSSPNRSLVHLNEKSHYKLKSTVISDILITKNKHKGLLKIQYENDQFQLEYIKAFVDQNVLLVIEEEQINQNYISIIKQKQRVKFRVIQGKKEQIRVSEFYITSQMTATPLFISLQVQSTVLVIQKVQLSGQTLKTESLELEIQTKEYLYRICTECDQPFSTSDLIDQLQCRICKKSKQFKLNFFVPEAQLQSATELASMESSKVEKIQEIKSDGGCFDYLCCFSKKKQIE